MKAFVFFLGLLVGQHTASAGKVSEQPRLRRALDVDSHGPLTNPTNRVAQVKVWRSVALAILQEHNTNAVSRTSFEARKIKTHPADVAAVEQHSVLNLGQVEVLEFGKASVGARSDPDRP